MPCLYFNSYSLFKNLLFHFEQNLLKLNQKLYFNSKNFKKQIENCDNSNLNSMDVELEINECCLDECLKKKFNYNSQVPLMKETLDFKFSFFKSLKTNSFKYKTNISIDEFKSIFYFLKNNPFTITECDKNIGTAIISNELYKELSLKHLSNSIYYETIDLNPLNSTQLIIKNELNYLFSNKHISKNLYKRLILNECKLGKFRILPKLHKDKFGFRPIINCKNHPTSNICILIDFILQPFVRKSPSFIQDSQNFIQKTINNSFPLNSKIYSLDFESLYTNIILDDALKIISDFISNNFNSDEITSTGFHTLLKLIFNNNVFSFQNFFFRQIKGIAMGSNCGPSIANLFVHCLETNYLNIHKPLCYYRFIDDIFVIIKNDSDINFLINNFESLSLNISSEKIVNFLDLNICISPSNGFLNYSLYIKKTNTFSYLLNTSNHPSFIFKNIPKSLFFRLKRICSFSHDYFYYSRILIKQLIDRGYDSETLSKICRMVYNLDKKSILEYKIKNKNSTSKNIYFQLPYNMNYNLNTNINSAFNSINSNSYLLNYNFKFINSIEPNISSLFIHKFKLNKTFKMNYKKCDNINCLICSFSDNSSYIKIDDFFLPLLNTSSCLSKNIIYIIKCLKCNVFYIGESIILKRRMRTHIVSCLNNYSSSHTSCVYKHFNSSLHNISTDFRFYIFKTDVSDLMDRKNIETQLIHLFKVFNINILNEKINDIYYYKKFVNLF